MRGVLPLAALIAAVLAAPGGAGRECPARVPLAGDSPLGWSQPASSVDASNEMDAWCRAVGPPLVVRGASGSSAAPPLEALAVVSWNAHLTNGRVPDLVADLRAGRWTGGAPVEHFVLLLQEVVRRGDDVPPFGPEARTAFAIAPTGADAPDIREHAEHLGAHVVYVPSMRNGADREEDRGSAVVSTDPLRDLSALELPLERQRRVAIAATIDVRLDRLASPLRVATAHLEPLSAPSSFWLFRNPRRRQMAALLDWLAAAPASSDAAGVEAQAVVMGGDFNTIQGGDDEAVYRLARAWSRGLTDEDARPTHGLGRLDYVFPRLPPPWSARTVRLDDRYGSDHHPVMARFFAGAHRE